DRIDGLGGDDIIYGGNGSDVLIGGLGDDQLVGDRGDDVLNGSRGLNDLFGGSGHDQFVIGFGTDTIWDFTVGEDAFVLKSGLKFQDLYITQGTNSQTQETFTAIFQHGSNVPLALLPGVKSDSLNETDFQESNFLA
ncbi:MAG: calcium-binding protein, partial [Cyanobacteria bacterium J06638_38]